MMGRIFIRNKSFQMLFAVIIGSWFTVSAQAQQMPTQQAALRPAMPGSGQPPAGAMQAPSSQSRQSIPLPSQVVPQVAPITTDSRIKTLVYNANEVYQLKFHYGYQSFIEFSNDEE